VIYIYRYMVTGSVYGQGFCIWVRDMTIDVYTYSFPACIPIYIYRYTVMGIAYGQDYCICKCMRGTWYTHIDIWSRVVYMVNGIVYGNICGESICIHVYSYCMRGTWYTHIDIWSRVVYMLKGFVHGNICGIRDITIDVYTYRFPAYIPIYNTLDPFLYAIEQDKPKQNQKKTKKK